MIEQRTARPIVNSSGWKVWGNDRIVADLKQAAISGPRHAYILTGPDQVGKRSLALEFARALVCEHPSAPGVPCGDCSRCRRVLRGVYPDVTVADLSTQAARDKASSTSRNTTLNISTVRDISSDLALRPSEAYWRVAIVDDVETMQETAQEAFLKTLEEPPSYTVILLLTSDVELLLPTILSRCVVLHMQTTSDSIVREALEAGGLPDDEADAIAELSEGRIGWAFDAANDKSKLTARRELQASAGQWASAGDYQRLINATNLADSFLKDRETVFNELLAVQQVWRSIMIQSIVNRDSAPQPSPRRLVAAVRSVERCILDLEANVRPRLAMQTMVLQWPALT